MVGRGGFEPPKRSAADLQSAPFGHSGTYPHSLSPTPVREWSWRCDLNPQPADYKSAALPIELRQPILRSTATPSGIPGPSLIASATIYIIHFSGEKSIPGPSFFCILHARCTFIKLFRPPPRSPAAGPLRNDFEQSLPAKIRMRFQKTAPARRARAQQACWGYSAALTAVMWGLTPSYQ